MAQTKPKLTQRELDALQRCDFGAFLRIAFHAATPGTKFQWNWHIDAMVYDLHRVANGDLRRLIMNLPPRSLKSLTVSVAYVAWLIGRNPGMRVLVVSYNKEYASYLHGLFRKVVKSDAYRRLFPWVHWTTETATDLVTSESGGRLATSVNGQITGRGGDLLIIDDPLNANEANADSARRRANDFFGRALLSRENDPGYSKIIVVAQRLHADDLTGHLLKSGTAWERLVLPARADEESMITLSYGHIKRWQVGELLHPARVNQAALEEAERALGPYIFAAQYQQRPVPVEGNLVKRAHLQFYDALPPPEPGDEVVLSIDPAYTDGPNSDYSAVTVWRARRNDVYLLDVWRGKLAFADLKPQIAAIARKHRANRVLLEDVSIGKLMLQDFQRDTPVGMPRPIGIAPEGDKKHRMIVQSARFQEGVVMFPKDADFMPGYLAELLGFPNAEHDDQVDSTTQFLWWWTGRRQVLNVALPIIVRVPRLPDPWSPPSTW